MDWDISSLEIVPETNSNIEEIHHSKIYIAELEKQVFEAKTKELNSWKEQNVYVEEEDSGQPCISVKWVISRKVVDGNNITKVRLCARGFEELQDFASDFPCCSRIGVRSIFVLIASQNWNITSIHVKTAFLQGIKIERIIYLRPPKEANTSKVWKLEKCAYVLADASRYWYLRVREELLKLWANWKEIFNFGHEEMEAFTYVGIGLK